MLSDATLGALLSSAAVVPPRITRSRLKSELFRPVARSVRRCLHPAPHWGALHDVETAAGRKCLGDLSSTTVAL
jgi:hypothetical protein